MPAQTSDLVVVAAPARAFVPLLDVLRDWSSLSLISPVWLVNLDDPRSNGIQVPCLVLEGGRTRPAVLGEELASGSQSGRSRLVLLSDASEGVVADQSAAMRLRTQIGEALPMATVEQVHLIGVAHGAPGPAVDPNRLAWLGWHNVLVAPENSLSPTEGVSPIIYSPKDPVRRTHLTGAVCSLAGLWTAERSAPLDDRQPAPGNTLMLGRTFTRQLSASAVESELLTRVSGVSRGYPAPLVETGPAEIVEDETGAATAQAEALAAKYPHVFASQRDMPQRTSPKPIGLGQAIKLFLSFLGKALVGAPRAFLDAALAGVARGTAAGATRMLFGTGDSTYKVVVKGIGPDGLPASFEQQDEHLGTIAKQLPSPPSAQSNADLSELWRDFVSGGLTLLDAGARDTQLPPCMVGSKRAIVSSPTSVAPDPRDTFHVPDHVATYVKSREVAPYDVLGGGVAFQELSEAAAKQPHAAGELGQTRSALQQWFGERERSYAGVFGRRLYSGVSSTRQEIETYAQALRAAMSDVAVPPDIEQQQRSLASRLRIILAIAAALALAAILLAVLGVIGLVVMIVILLVIGGGWFGISVATFTRGQQRLFQLLHERREAADHVSLLQTNLQGAIGDLRRLLRAYRQYLDWARALGTFVQAPHGYVTAQADSDVLLGSGFPRNHRFGAALPEDAVVEQTAARLKDDLFPVGWASDAWASFLADLPPMGTEGFRIEQNPDLLLSDPAIAQESLLTTWSLAVAERRWTGGVEALREKVARALTSQHRELGSRLLARVSTRQADGRVVTQTLEEFINGLDSAANTPGAFGRATFSSGAQAQEPWRVPAGGEGTSTSESAEIFGRTVIVTQLSAGFTAFDTDLGALTTGQPGQTGQATVVADASPLDPGYDLGDAPVSRPDF